MLKEKPKRPHSNVDLIALFLFAVIAIYFIIFLRPAPKPKIVPTATHQQSAVGGISPEKIEEILTQAQDANLSQGWAPKPEADHLWGTTSAPVQIVVYLDFASEFCADYMQTLKQAKKEFGNQLAIVARHFPMTAIYRQSLGAALAAECAAEQGKFWEMADALFADQKNFSMAQDQYLKDAKNLGLQVKDFEECLKSEKYKEKVLTQIEQAKKIGVSGVPASFLNGRPLPGAYPYEDFVSSDGLRKQGLKSLIEEFITQTEEPEY